MWIVFCVLSLYEGRVLVDRARGRWKTYMDLYLSLEMGYVYIPASTRSRLHFAQRSVIFLVGNLRGILEEGGWLRDDRKSLGSFL